MDRVHLMAVTQLVAPYHFFRPYKRLSKLPTFMSTFVGLEVELSTRLLLVEAPESMGEVFEAGQ